MTPSIIMSLLCVLVFSRKDKIYSRGLLGFGAVVAVTLSLMTGYGLMFIAGVTFSTLTQVKTLIFPIICVILRVTGEQDINNLKPLLYTVCCSILFYHCSFYPLLYLRLVWMTRSSSWAHMNVQTS